MQNVEGAACRPLPALFLPPTVHLAVQAVQRIGQPAHVVDDAQRHRLLAVQHGAHIVGHIAGGQHQLTETVLADVAVGRHELHDALPYPLEVAVCLRRGDDRAGHAHGVDGHGCGVGNKRLLSAHRQRHADGVAAAQHRGKDPGWDPLAFVVEECHKRGMECHAWVNPYRFSTGSNWSTVQDQALKSAGMLLAYTKSDGKTTTILNPGLESVRKRIVDVCKEIISNYDVDGLVFDDYFYPEGIPVTSSAGDYDLWQKSGASMTFGDWRRNNVNQMVADVYKMVQQQKPYVRFGISPAGAACTSAAVAAKHGIDRCPVASDWQYDGIFSDPVAWLEAGTIDYISPQLYWKTNHKTNPFGPMTKWWSYVAKHFGRHHYASHSISFLNSSNTTSDWEEIGKQVQFSRDYTENEAPGAVFYSAAYVTGKKQSGFGEWLQVNKFQNKALTPAIDWKKSDLEKVQVSALNKRATVLSWTGVDNVRYSVYAVPESVNVETLDSNIPAEYLLGVSYKTTYTMPDDKKSGYNYAVCVLDRYGNEYEPVYYGQSGVECIGGNSGLTADYADGELRLSAVADEVFVYNEAGALVANSRNCNRLALSVQAGMYIVRMIGNGGVSTEKIIVK